MALVVTKAGARFLLDAQFTFTPCRMHLYQNDVTPDVDTVVGDLTECDFGGYTSLSVAGWSVAITVSDHAKTFANLLQWQHDLAGASNDIYGYWIEDANTADLLWVERDPAAPVDISVTNPLYQVIPTFTRISEFP